MDSLKTIAIRLKKRLSWNVQYLLGRWDRLNSPLEQPRFDQVIAMMTKYGKKGSAVLEVGCGEGLFYKKLDPTFYSRFFGIDLSLIAIKKANKIKKDRAGFAARDMETYQPKETFDIIIFNECIYYSDRAEQVFRDYLHYLSPGGQIILSVYEMDFTMKVLDDLTQKFSFKDRVKVQNELGSWHILIHEPGRAAA